MEQESELVFTVMVFSPELLEEGMSEYNKSHETDFEIVEVIEDEVPFCRVRVTKHAISDIFGLGHGVTALYFKLRREGKIAR